MKYSKFLGKLAWAYSHCVSNKKFDAHQRDLYLCIELDAGIDAIIHGSFREFVPFVVTERRHAIRLIETIGKIEADSDRDFWQVLQIKYTGGINCNAHNNHLRAKWLREEARFHAAQGD